MTDGKEMTAWAAIAVGSVTVLAALLPPTVAVTGTASPEYSGYQCDTRAFYAWTLDRLDTPTLRVLVAQDGVPWNSVHAGGACQEKG